MKRFLARYFQVYENGSSVGVEVRAGVTTFLTMSYILFVNPQDSQQGHSPPGLTAVTTGLLFALAVFFWPLAAAVPAAATAPALILVGSMMAVHLSHIQWKDYSEIIPSFLTMAIMPFTYSIANGVSFGIISYMLIKLLSGRGKELHPVTIVLGILLIIRYVVLGRD